MSIRLKAYALALCATLGFSHTASAFTAYGVTDQLLYKVAPQYETYVFWSVTGLQATENLVGIDSVAAGNKLYVVTDQNRIYDLSPTNGQATLISNAPFADPALVTALAFEAIPGSQEARIIGNHQENLRVSLATGDLVSSATTLSYAAGDDNEGTVPDIRGITYSPADSTLYGLDEQLSLLVKIGGPAGSPSADTSVVTTVGALGPNWGPLGPNTTKVPSRDSLDAGPDGILNIARAAHLENFPVFGGTAFLTIDPTSGIATSDGPFKGGLLSPAWTIVDDAQFADDDNDGVLNASDQCPNTPPLSVVTENGCIVPGLDFTGAWTKAKEKRQKGIGKVNATFNILKVGEEPVSTITVRFHSSNNDSYHPEVDPVIGTQVVKLKKKGVSKVKFKYDFINGFQNVRVFAVIDPAGQVNEVNEINNVISLTPDMVDSKIK